MRYAILFVLACAGSPRTDYRQEMREFVQNLSAYARKVKPGFLVVPQNGHDLLTTNGKADGPLAKEYVKAIDGLGREDLNYGYEEDDRPTPARDREAMIGFMDLALKQKLQVLAIDYCSTRTKVDDAYSRCAAKGYLSFVADHRHLDNVPSYPATPPGASKNRITSLAQAKNFLYLINPGAFDSKSALLDAVRATNHDVAIIDLFYQSAALTAEDVASLKKKSNGGSRLILAYMSIGEAEDYRWYWKKGWKAGAPAWLDKENPKWKGNFKVRYWDREWQKIIYGTDGSYLRKIIEAGFDGVYLDIIDAFEYFEEKDK